MEPQLIHMSVSEWLNFASSQR